MSERPPAWRTARVLSSGTLLAAALFSASFVMTIAGATAASIPVATGGVIVLLLTPAAGLLSSALELRPRQPRVAALALIVLGIMGIAAGFTFLAPA